MPLRILCDAIAFCYGPAAALSTLLKALTARNGHNFQFDVLATGTTRELLQRNGHGLELIEVDSTNASALKTIDPAKYDAFINVCNPVSYDHLGTKLATVYVDFLLWMHEGVPLPHFGADLYLAEGYPGTEEWARSRAAEIRNLHVIPPLIQPAPYSRSSGTLLVGLGGLISDLTPLSAALTYVRSVMGPLLKALNRDRFNEVIVACGEPVAQVLKTEFNERAVRFESLSHEDFLEELSACEAFVSHPGLYAVFEAMMGGVPTALLPPSNYTQVLQLRHYRRIGIAQHSFAWEDLGLPLIASGLPEPEGVRLTIEQVESARQLPQATSELSLMLERFFSLENDALAELGERQRKVCSSFGLDGPAQAARAVEKWLAEL